MTKPPRVRVGVVLGRASREDRMVSIGLLTRIGSLAVAVTLPLCRAAVCHTKYRPCILCPWIRDTRCPRYMEKSPLTARHTASQVRRSMHATDAGACRKPQGSETRMTGDRAEARLIRTRAASRRASAARGVTPCSHIVCSRLTSLFVHHPAEAPLRPLSLGRLCPRTIIGRANSSGAALRSGSIQQARGREDVGRAGKAAKGYTGNGAYATNACVMTAPC